jgi:5-formyltetrahydrofolate cyclo-ligase
MITSEKIIIRKELNYLRNSQSDTVRNNANSAICRSLSDLNEVKNAGMIAAYMPLGKEVDLTAFFAKFAEKRYAFPRCINTEREQLPEYEMVEVPGKAFTKNEVDNYFSTGKYGIMEPKEGLPVIEREEIEVWLVPGVGFDISGNRIGRGGGVYDCLLSGVGGVKIGIGYEVQLIDRVPTGPEDELMNLIVNEGKMIRS